MFSLEAHFQQQNVDLSIFPQTEFDGPPAERAVLFSSPGGLKDTLGRGIPVPRERRGRSRESEPSFPTLTPWRSLSWKGLPRCLSTVFVVTRAAMAAQVRREGN